MAITDVQLILFHNSDELLQVQLQRFMSQDLVFGDICHIYNNSQEIDPCENWNIYGCFDMHIHLFLGQILIL